jgi:hypothetical protein
MSSTLSGLTYEEYSDALTEHFDGPFTEVLCVMPAIVLGQLFLEQASRFAPGLRQEVAASLLRLNADHPHGAPNLHVVE